MDYSDTDRLHPYNASSETPRMPSTAMGCGQCNDTVVGPPTRDVTFDEVVDDFKRGLYRHQETQTIILICCYVIVFMLALLGNMMVLLVILRNKAMRNVTNYFLLNLAIADLLVTLVCIPLTVGEVVYRTWIYGLFMCKAAIYVQGVCISASVLTYMTLSLDRYMAIRHPVKSRRVSRVPQARAALVCIWAVSSASMVPLAVVRTLHWDHMPNGESFAYCHEMWSTPAQRRAFDLFLFVFIYVLPGGIMVFSYASTGCRLLEGDRALRRQGSEVYLSYRVVAQRRRLARMLVILALLFAFSWMPYHAVSLAMDFNMGSQGQHTLSALSFALLLGHSHSAQNPILYIIMNQNFKRGMVALIRCRRFREVDVSRVDTQRTTRDVARGNHSARLSHGGNTHVSDVIANQAAIRLMEQDNGGPFRLGASSGCMTGSESDTHTQGGPRDDPEDARDKDGREGGGAGDGEEEEEENIGDFHETHVVPPCFMASGAARKDTAACGVTEQTISELIPLKEGAGVSLRGPVYRS